MPELNRMALAIALNIFEADQGSAVTMYTTPSSPVMD